MKTVLKKKDRVNKKLAERLAKEVELTPTITEYFCDHGYKTKDEIKQFIDFQEKDLRRMALMEDAIPFLKILKGAIINKKNIVVWGDYDGDGICATAIFMWTFKWLGVKANWFISNRFTEGYGMSVKALERLLKEYPETDLIVTCDNGIVAFEAVEYANSRGVDVIISDHHEASPDGRLPDCPVVCEKRLDEDKTKIEGFCGAELARRICFNLICVMNNEQAKRQMYKLYAFSGFATITDVIDFNASNHFVAKKGLQEINSDSFVCFKALKQALGINRLVDEVSIGYKLGAMVNAAGRIVGDATIPLELFIEEDEGKALCLAEQLMALNEKRQQISLEEQKLVVKEIEKNGYEKDNFIIVSEHEYMEGIAGLNASYIVDNYKVPAICFCEKEDDPTVLKGSGRSVEGFDLKHALDLCKELLVGYGGHPMAAGLSIKRENLEVFRNKMNEIAKNVETMEKVIDIDYLLEPEDLSIELANEYINILAPFGTKFEKPVFAVEGTFKDEPLIMKEKHIRTSIIGNSKEVTLLWFNSILKYKKKSPDNQSVIAIGQPTENKFNGQSSLQFIADDIFVEHSHL